MRPLLVCLLIALGVAAASTQAAARSRARFVCRWNFSLDDGVRATYVTAGNSTTCTGERGALTLRSRLQEWDPTTRKWRTAKSRRRTWTRLNGHRYVRAAKRCDGGRYRAEFTSILRHDGRVLIQKSLQKGPISAPVGCKITLGSRN
jgi:hypothetical protein